MSYYSRLTGRPESPRWDDHAERLHEDVPRFCDDCGAEEGDQCSPTCTASCTGDSDCLCREGKADRRLQREIDRQDQTPHDGFPI